ncbi:hypothetical protein M0R72_07965 [Candidatus Pacearchaeota archaeon]|jgi:hypothetical protein|nr:hypothetical protein [Candidatus Pacearchaeota archaeon]
MYKHVKPIIDISLSASDDFETIDYLMTFHYPLNVDTPKAKKMQERVRAAFAGFARDTGINAVVGESLVDDFFKMPRGKIAAKPKRRKKGK